MTWMIEQQSQTFLISIICGILTGFVIGIMHELKKVIRIGNVAMGVLDMMLWLALCASVVMVTYEYNSGNIRLYIFFGFLSGIGIYFATIGWVISKIIDYILCCTKNALKKVKFIIKKLVDIIRHS